MVVTNMSRQAKPTNDKSSNTVELNVGGTMYVTTFNTLLKKPDSQLAKLFKDANKAELIRDAQGKVFIDPDGVLFRYILDYLRNLKLVLPENFQDQHLLKQEAEYFHLPDLVRSLGLSKLAGYLTGCRGTFMSGRDGVSDTKFRKLSRIIVCGKVSLCREVFKETMNESRDSDRGKVNRYTGRFYLKHTFLELAFDMLQDEGFNMVGCCGIGTNSNGDIKPENDMEEARWQHFTDFLFRRC